MAGIGSVYLAARPSPRSGSINGSACRKLPDLLAGVTALAVRIIGIGVLKRRWPAKR